MAQTTFNVTVPHTSPHFYYDSTKWTADCPNDTCGAEIGSHVTNVTSATVTINFWGKSIYIYGDAETGMDVSMQLNGEPDKKVTPSNGMLVAIDDITTICRTSTSCVRDASLVDPSSSSAQYGYNRLRLTTTQFTVGARARISKAVFNPGTRRSGATTSIKTYANNDAAIRYTTGWALNGTYMQSGTDLRQTFDFNFDGQALWLWGFCGKRERFDFGGYGQVTINGNQDSLYDFTDGPSLSDPKCLLYFVANLPDTSNVMKFDSETYNAMIDSIDVLQATGGDPVALTSTTTRFGSSPTSFGGPSSIYGTDNGPSKAVMVAVPVVIIALALAAGIAAAILFRRSRKRKNAAAIGGEATMGQYKPMATPNSNQAIPNLPYTPPTH